ncbi:MAG: radical SAM protein, partial [Candidatus Binatia bacterium]
METAAREFQIMVKTIGAICNLDCHYCYYLQKEELYPKGTNFRLNDETLERYILQHIQATPGEIVSFSWHGGEPTLLGVDFFRKAVEFQKKYLTEGKKIINGIQTNGTTIDQEWCEFLAQENFYIGLSLDGPRELHDHYRVTKGQKPTHKQVVQAFHMLRKAKVHVDLLCVVHDINVQHPTQVYRYLKEIGGEYLQFLPLVEKTGDPNNPAHKRS